VEQYKICEDYAHEEHASFVGDKQDNDQRYGGQQKFGLKTIKDCLSFVYHVDNLESNKREFL